jgi:hypothetical protein
VPKETTCNIRDRHTAMMQTVCFQTESTAVFWLVACHIVIPHAHTHVARTQRVRVLCKILPSYWSYFNTYLMYSITAVWLIRRNKTIMLKHSVRMLSLAMILRNWYRQWTRILHHSKLSLSDYKTKLLIHGLSHLTGLNENRNFNENYWTLFVLVSHCLGPNV